MTAVEYQRASAGLLLLGSYDRSVPRSCGWQTRKGGSDQNEQSQKLQRISLSPSRNPQIWRWMAERILKILSACVCVGGMEADMVAERLSVTPTFEDLGTTCKPKKTVRLPQKPLTPSESAMRF